MRVLSSVLGSLVQSSRHSSRSSSRANRSPRHGFGSAKTAYGASAGSTGWELLEHGSHGAALHAFARDAERHPGDGVPKVGYALAAAEVGELEAATWAMRRVYRLDPGAAARAPVGHGLDPRVRGLIHRYRERARHGGPTGDSAFMVAALHHILGEDEAAHEALRDVRGHADDAPSTVALVRALER